MIPNGIDWNAAQQAAKKPVKDLAWRSWVIKCLRYTARLAPGEKLTTLLDAMRRIVEKARLI
ncbi:MAG: hypothetical protein R3F37_16335 [Candidatus Competibacteraceae bacterium]